MGQDAALIIEGGGMRGAFTMGVLNGMIDAHIEFPYLIGMSSGALAGLLFLSKQQDLAKEFYPRIARAGAKAFGVRPWIKGKGLFNLSYIAEHLIGEEQIDYEAIFAHPARYLIGTTRARTGQLVFWEKSQVNTPYAMQRLVTASASLPVLAPSVRINKEAYVDGGIIESIPIQQALDDGYQKMIVIHTQPRGYQKNRQRLEPISLAWLKRFPVLQQAIQTRHLRYNATLKRMFAMEEAGSIFVICPDHSEVGRYGIDENALVNYYHQGYALFWEKVAEIRDFLGLSHPVLPDGTQVE